jgi:hypothetical protein
MQQLINDEPSREYLGPFKATDANIHTTKTHGMAYFSFKMMEPLLGADLTACQVLKLSVPALVDAGLEDNCVVMIIFLIVSVVQPTADCTQCITVHSQVGNAGYAPGPLTINS